ncbi:heparinase II/III family protein [Leptothoe sp. LEGE 181152]|nr:heparinase II/III family protein [Leptothoe sp. LEGE 181152]
MSLLKILKKQVKGNIFRYLPRFITYSTKIPRFTYESFTWRWLREKIASTIELEPFIKKKKLKDSDSKVFGNVILSQTLTNGLLGYLYSNKKVLKNYHRNQLQLVPGEASIPFKTPLPWGENPTQRIYYIRVLHFLGYLVPLLQEARKTGDRQYLIAAENILIDWLKSNPYPNGAHTAAWYEGCVVHRLGVLLEFLKTYKALGSSQNLPLYKLLATIHQHVSYLYFKRNQHYQIGNHGLRQDILLIIASYAMPYFQEAPTWRQVALLGLEKQLTEYCSEEGVWLEHTPGYQVYIDQWLWYLMHFLKENQLPIPQVLKGFFELSDQYITHIMLPDGTLPTIGDTANMNAVRSLARGWSPGVTYVMSQGKEGQKPEELDKFFPTAGEATLRDIWGNTPEEYQKTFYICCHSSQHLPLVHRHEDALSFIVYGAGRHWIIDPGRYAFTLDKKYNQFFKSAYAHNTCAIRDQALAPQQHPELSATLSKDHLSTDQLAVVSMLSQRFPRNGKVTRYLIFVRHEKLLFVIDQFEGSEKEHWQFVMPFAPDLEASRNEHSICVEDTKNNDTTLDILLGGDFSTSNIQLIRGQESPLLGWTFDAEKQSIDPCFTMVVNHHAQQGYGIRVLHWRAVDQPALSSIQSHTINNGYKIICCDSHKQHEVTLQVEPSLKATFTSLNPQ